jgi:hypothetical protein
MCLPSAADPPGNFGRRVDMEKTIMNTAQNKFGRWIDSVVADLNVHDSELFEGAVAKGRWTSAVVYGEPEGRIIRLTIETLPEDLWEELGESTVQRRWG